MYSASGRQSLKRSETGLLGHSRGGGLLSPRLRAGNDPAHVRGGLRVGVTEPRLHGGHVLRRPGREVVIDRVQELERRCEANGGDRRTVSADERLPVEEEG